MNSDAVQFTDNNFVVMKYSNVEFFVVSFFLPRWPGALIELKEEKS